MFGSRGAAFFGGKRQDGGLVLVIQNPAVLHFPQTALFNHGHKERLQHTELQPDRAIEKSTADEIQPQKAKRGPREHPPHGTALTTIPLIRGAPSRVVHVFREILVVRVDRVMQEFITEATTAARVDHQ